MSADEEPRIPGSGAVFTFGKSRFADNIPSHFFIRNDPIVDLDCGDEHTAVVCRNGRVFSFGNNEWGQLGLSHRTAIAKPSCIKSLKPKKCVHVACGRAHTLVQTVCGQVYACGNNSDGQLGLGDRDSKDSPHLIQTLSDVTQLSAGFHHSAALTGEGKVYVWGSNTDGQLGLGYNVSSVDAPTLLPLSNRHVIQISCGYYHTALLTDEGEVLVFGEGESGKLGLGDNERRTQPTLLNLEPSISFIDAGGQHTIAITQDGTALGWGSNERGQLGMGELDEVSTPTIISALAGTTLKMVSCGESHSAFVTDSGELYSCGEARHGKLGLGEVQTNQKDPCKVSRFINLKVQQVKCGGCHTIVHAYPEYENGNMMNRSSSLEKCFTGALSSSNSSTRIALPPIQKAPSLKSNPSSTLITKPEHNSEIPVNHSQNASPTKNIPDNSPNQVTIPNLTNCKKEPRHEQKGQAAPAMPLDTHEDDCGGEGEMEDDLIESIKADNHQIELENKQNGNAKTSSEGRFSRFFSRKKKVTSSKLPQTDMISEAECEESLKLQPESVKHQSTSSQRKSKMCTIL